jgi:Rieske Fe-S protein
MNKQKRSVLETKASEGTENNRREFLKQTGLTIAAVATLGLTSAFADPDGNDDDGQRGNMNSAVGKGIVDLGAVTAFRVGAVADKTSLAGVMLSRTAQGLIALAPVCTHQGCAPKFSSAAKEFICACHGARFALDGAVTAAPARTPLSRYPIAIKNERVLVDTNKLIKRSKVSLTDFVRV